jgi:hypothetical protein
MLFICRRLKIKRRFFKKLNYNISDFVCYKSRFGVLVLGKSSKKIERLQASRWFLMFLRSIKRVNSLWYGMVGITGRGMWLQSMRRGILRGNARRRRFRKYLRTLAPVDYFQGKVKRRELRFVKNESKGPKKVKVVIAKKIRKRKRRRFSVKSLVRRSWFTFRKLDRRTFTHLGERGHFMLLRGKFMKLMFRRLNTIYKYIIIVGSNLKFFRAKILRFISSLIKLKMFSTYKMKGLKFFYQGIRIREGKGRKFI